jgi:hypothetical protein
LTEDLEVTFLQAKISESQSGKEDKIIAYFALLAFFGLIFFGIYSLIGIFSFLKGEIVKGSFENAVIVFLLLMTFVCAIIFIYGVRVVIRNAYKK